MDPSAVEAPREHGELHSHPEPRTYVAVAVVLAVVTGAEVGIYYITALSDAMLVAGLLAFALVKFALVAGFFMHLRFDSRMFRRLFVTGVVLAIIVFAIVLSTFFARGGPAPGLSG